MQICKPGATFMFVSGLSHIIHLLCVLNKKMFLCVFLILPQNVITHSDTKGCKSKTSLFPFAPAIYKMNISHSF